MDLWLIHAAGGASLGINLSKSLTRNSLLWNQNVMHSRENREINENQGHFMATDQFLFV